MIRLKTVAFRLLLPLLAGIVILPVSCKRTTDAAGSREASDILLKDDDIIGLKRSGSTRLATDNNSLYDIINGGAEEFIARGFREGAFQNYNSGTSAYSLDVYDQNSGENARTLWEERYPATGESYIAKTDEQGAVVDLNTYSINYFNDRFFIIIKSTEKTEAALNMTKLICAALKDKIEN